MRRQIRRSTEKQPAGDPFRRLQAAILLLAIRDMQVANGYAADAWVFLTGRRARAICEWLDLDPSKLDVFLAGQPVPFGSYQLALDLGWR
jgi:hypothetical protein